MSVVVLALLVLGCNDAGVAVGAPKSVPAAGPAPAAASAPAATATDEAVVASWSGGSLGYAELKEGIKNDLTSLEAEYLTSRYETETRAMDQHIAEQLVELEAKKRKLADGTALLKVEVEEKVSAPTEQEVQEAWTQVQRRFRGQELTAVRPQVEKMVTQKKLGERYQAFIGDLRKQYGVDVQLPFPDLPRFEVSLDDDPVLGPADAPVTIIQFADYQCYYCGTAQIVVDKVLKDYEGKVKFVFRDFPLDIHSQAVSAAVAANCAIPQDKFWPIHDAIMKVHPTTAMADADFVRLAEENGLDRSKWDACRQDPAMRAEVDKDMAEGAAVGVTGTPAFFINGVFLNGAQPYEKFQAIIDRELKKG